jgi:hypothetical protein
MLGKCHNRPKEMHTSPPSGKAGFADWNDMVFGFARSSSWELLSQAVRFFRSTISRDVKQVAVAMVGEMKRMHSKILWFTTLAVSVHIALGRWTYGQTRTGSNMEKGPRRGIRLEVPHY